MSKSMSNNVFKKKSGIQSIQEYLESGRSITALESLSNFGIFRLASSIELLRKRGMNIQTEMKKDPNGKTYARYTLEMAEARKKELKVGARVTTLVSVMGVPAGSVGVVTKVLNMVWPFTVEFYSGREVPFDADELEAI